jgi:hypothetical protein
MKSTVKIVKRKQGEDENDLKTTKPQKSVELATREVVSTVKGWISELKQRKRGQSHSFAPLPPIGISPASELSHNEIG